MTNLAERTPLLTRRRTSSVNVLQDSNIVTATNQDTIVPLSFGRALAIIASIFVLIFVFTVNITCITTIQSSIAVDLQATDEVSWFVSAFLIASTSVIPVAGKLCQIFSPRSYLLVSVVISIGGCLLTAFATNLFSFLVGRVICGVGAVAVTPVAFALVIRFASKERWGLLFGCINCGYTTGVATGAIVGGALEPKIGWRAVFWLQVPLSAVAVAVAYLAIPETSTPTSKSDVDDTSTRQKLAKIDYLGVLTLVITVVLLLYGLASAPVKVAPVVLSPFFLALFYLIESHWAEEPILPPSVLCSRGSILTGLATVGLMSARWGVLFYTPAYGIAVRGWPQAKAGFLLVPTNLGFGLGGVAVGLVHIKRAGSFYLPCLACFALFAGEHYAYAQMLTLESPLWLLVLGLFWNGFIAGSILNYSLAHLLHVTEPSHHALVIPLNTMFRGLSGSVGSSLMGGIFLRSLQPSLRRGFDDAGIKGQEETIRQLLGRPNLVQQLHGVAHKIALESYMLSIQHMMVAGSLFVAGMLAVQACVGWKAPKKQPVLAQQN